MALSVICRCIDLLFADSAWHQAEMIFDFDHDKNNFDYDKNSSRH